VRGSRTTGCASSASLKPKNTRTCPNFLNGGKELPDRRRPARSKKANDHDLQPEMSTNEVTDDLVAAIREPISR
jgi:hypothetical protein